ncbi:MAG: hypothetical protein KGM47_17090, partial [Acidobacteriota bacterium]|nr:hypothetical protein [Acidobacteriota bacterium]
HPASKPSGAAVTPVLNAAGFGRRNHEKYQQSPASDTLKCRFSRRIQVIRFHVHALRVSQNDMNDC